MRANDDGTPTALLTTIPYTTFGVKAFGIWVDAKVLLHDSNLYLIGRVPFFSLTEIGFVEDQVDRSRNRLLYTHYRPAVKFNTRPAF